MVAAIDLTTSLRAIESYALACGYFTGVQIGEPRAVPQGGLTAAIIMQAQRVDHLVLDAPVEVHTVLLRVYRNMLAEPEEDGEILVSRAVSKFLTDLYNGSISLGGAIRHVDVAGAYGTPVGTRWGYLDVSGVMHRIADVTIPLVVDAAASTFAA